ncbi:protein rolling stone-like [Styela clava]
MYSDYSTYDSCRVEVCLCNMATAVTYEFQCKHFGFTDVTPKHFYESQWTERKEYFVVYRAIMFLYCLIWAIYDTNFCVSSYSGYYITHLSSWGEWTLVVHFGLALAVSMFGLIQDSDFCFKNNLERTICCGNGNTCQINDIKWFHNLCWVVMTAASGVSYIVTISYWCFSDNRMYSIAVNTHQHIMNSVLMTMDHLLSRVPTRYLHFVYVSLYGAVYTLFTVILHLIGIRPMKYSGTLDWTKSPEISIVVSLGLVTVGACVIHFITFTIFKLRDLTHYRLRTSQTKSALFSDTSSHSNKDINANERSRILQ